MQGEQWKNIGLPLDARAGLLIAFRSEVFHEVQPVTHGQRLSVVGWFTGKDENGQP
jgi:SM-20-related protein